MVNFCHRQVATFESLCLKFISFWGICDLDKMFVLLVSCGEILSLFKSCWKEQGLGDWGEECTDQNFSGFCCNSLFPAQLFWQLHVDSTNNMIRGEGEGGWIFFLASMLPDTSWCWMFVQGHVLSIGFSSEKSQVVYFRKKVIFFSPERRRKKQFTANINAHVQQILSLRLVWGARFVLNSFLGKAKKERN